ncbi:hypothetical protein JGB26_19355 [Streptomyces flavofungini]|uniref:6-phosphogluconate dehydrogenase NADP-binding domain-containing protein n=2 Tax=Streptomyces flavofungini TaxID=68200 RepID=A0ABS0X7Q5_9ACTN|nr:hypothetical protein [Streptomyces flavofungini]
MGHALASALLDSGREVVVWNRTAAKGDDLVERGAVRADSTPAQLVQGLDVQVAGVANMAETSRAAGVDASALEHHLDQLKELVAEGHTM